MDDIDNFSLDGKSSVFIIYAVVISTLDLIHRPKFHRFVRCCVRSTLVSHEEGWGNTRRSNDHWGFSELFDLFLRFFSPTSLEKELERAPL